METDLIVIEGCLLILLLWFWKAFLFGGSWGTVLFFIFVFLMLAGKCERRKTHEYRQGYGRRRTDDNPLNEWIEKYSDDET